MQQYGVRNNNFISEDKHLLFIHGTTEILVKSVFRWPQAQKLALIQISFADFFVDVVCDIYVRGM